MTRAQLVEHYRQLQHMCYSRELRQDMSATTQIVLLVRIKLCWRYIARATGWPLGDL